MISSLWDFFHLILHTYKKFLPITQCSLLGPLCFPHTHLWVELTIPQQPFMLRVSRRTEQVPLGGTDSWADVSQREALGS